MDMKFFFVCSLHDMTELRSSSRLYLCEVTDGHKPQGQFSHYLNSRPLNTIYDHPHAIGIRNRR